VRYRFGVFAFDDRTALLTRAGRPVSLEPQPARALALLVARAGDLVTREEMRAHIWGGDTHVDFDRGLAYCIGQLRSALGDTADNPRFVQTLPRRGFTFIAPVEVNGEVGPKGPTLQAPEEPAPSHKTIAIAFALVAGIAAAAGAWMAINRPAARPIVAVAVFENETDDASYSRAVARLSDVIVERLTALGPSRIGVDGNAGILRRPRDARDWRAVAHDTGASFLVAGQLQIKDGALSLLMYMIRLDDGTHVWVQRIPRPAGHSLTTLDADVASQIESAVRRIVLKS
jgi:DNA-binding winged helix-turn-helix (wHTH) protein/TolB-like protein